MKTYAFVLGVSSVVAWVSSCGESPSFTQSEQGVAKVNQGDSTSAGSTPSSSNADEGVDSKTTSSGSAGSSSGSATGSGASGSAVVTSGASSSSSGGATSGGAGSTSGGSAVVASTGSSSGGSSSGGTSAGGAAPAPVVIVPVPGVPTIRMGISFNDNTFTANDDKDFNDAVVCFEGPFKYNAADKSIWSDRDQTIPVRINSLAGCKENVVIEIIKSDGSAESFTYASNINKSVNVFFPAGSRMRTYVTMTYVYGACSGTAVGRSHYMEDANWFKIEKDVCRTTGN